LRSLAAKNWRTVENDREKFRFLPLEKVWFMFSAISLGFCGAGIAVKKSSVKT
jgi:hypothetical protein